MLRKYWFSLFLGTILVASTFVLEPSWDRAIERLVSIALAAWLLWYFVDRLNRIEGKLDALLKKLDDH
jgi:hypothetical protein